ncbi:dual oxidase maturation factor 1-like isoform X2 [Penaeus japonicus]|uniref:dual oxidase maturation factor 1-like isoform X2 n=1 Tax=Penaeus japonicus TaxID=27405 RepID=UPI001C70B5E6|nr:dual oxidase maturation factor 1-like isoform X2 [Penaeus japonicus]
MSRTPYAAGWFDVGREKPFPAIYPELKTPVTVDVLEAGWVAAFFTLLVPFLVIVPAFTGCRHKILVFIRISFFLLLGLSIMLCNFGQDWEVGQLTTRTAYRAGTAEEITAKVGVRLGLRSVNVTLKAGQIQRDFRAAQQRGIPYPILWVAEYFTYDGEGFRFGRHYRLSGWFAHICVWFAFPLWLLTIILFKINIKYASETMILMGASLTSAAIIWATHRNSIELQIPFEDGVLKTHFGVYWYLCLAAGIVCIILGSVFRALADDYNDELSAFFGNNPLQYVEEEIAEEDTEEQSGPANEIEMESMGTRHPTLRYRTRARGTRIWKEQPLLVNNPPRPFLSSVAESRQRVVPRNYQQPPAGQAYGNQGYDEQEYDQIDNQAYQQQGYHPTQGYQAHGYEQSQGYGAGYQEEEEEPLYSNVERPAVMPVVVPPRPPKPSKY